MINNLQNHESKNLWLCISKNKYKDDDMQIKLLDDDMQIMLHAPS